MKNNKKENSINENVKLQDKGETMKLYGENSFFEHQEAFAPLSNSILSEDDLIVTEKAIRDTGKENRCYSCGKSVGEKHDKDCQTIRKIVRVNLCGYVDVSLPANLDYPTTVYRCEYVVFKVEACINNNIGDALGDIFRNSSLYLATLATNKLAIIEEDINPNDE